jgi:uncharacterized OB-fold protein
VGPGAGRREAEAGSASLIDPDGPLELTDGAPRLVAGRCTDCGALTFPLRRRCPTCGGDVERTSLPRRGTLWTWTTQGFEPPSPPWVPDGDGGEFEPYAVGYVEFPGCLRVEGRLTEAREGHLRIGMPMEVVRVSRGDRVTYAFAPAAEPPVRVSGPGEGVRANREVPPSPRGGS